MSDPKGIRESLSVRARILCAAFVLMCACAILPGGAFASGIKVVPSAEQVRPGEGFHVDIVVEDIPSIGLGAVQFRLNVDVPGGQASGVPDLSQGSAGAVSVVSPLIIGPSTEGHSGFEGFFWDGRGSHGVLVMDNEALQSGSALYTFGHTNGAVRPSGSGAVARFYFSIGEDVLADEVNVSLSDVVLLDSGEVYPLESNEGATVAIGCSVEVPSLLGLTLNGASTQLSSVELRLGTVSEAASYDSAYNEGDVVYQSVVAGSSIQCGTAIELVLNPAIIITDITNLTYTDKADDESGTVVLGWMPSDSEDVGGYLVYDATGTLLVDITDATATGTEISGLPEGTPTQLVVKAYDSLGNESEGVSISVQPFDDVAPSITVTGVVDGGYYSSSLVPDVLVSDAGPTTLQALLNGAEYLFAAIGIDGEYTLSFTAEDDSGNSTTVEFSFVIDTTAPSVSLDGVDDGIYYNADVTPVISSTDANPGTVTITLNGSAFESGTTVQVEGTYELSVTIEDLAGNTAGETVTFHIDKTAPVSTVALGTPVYESDTVYVTDATQFTLSASDGLSGVTYTEYRINGGQWTGYSVPFKLAGLADGEVTIEYRTADTAGNVENTNSTVVQLDTTAPSVTMAADGSTHDGDAFYVASVTEFTLSAADALSGVALVEYQIDGGDWLAYSGAFTLAGEGSHMVAYRSTDNLGNMSSAGSLTVALDITAPESSIEVGSPQFEGGSLFVTSETGITITATDGLSEVASIEYRIDEGEWTAYSGAVTLGTEGSHTLGYRATDNVGNMEDERSLSVVVDNAAPSTTITVGNPQHEHILLFISADTGLTLESTDSASGVALVEYRIEDGQWTAYSGAFTVPGEGGHNVYYRSVDNLGNAEAEQSLLVFLDNIPPDVTLSLDGVSYDSGEALYITSATRVVVDAFDAGSGVEGMEYRVDGGEWTAYSGTFTLTGEDSHTVYARATDWLGNSHSADSLAVVLDDTAPETTIAVGEPQYMGDALYVRGATQFTLTATDSLSGVGVSEYRIDDGEWTVYSGAFTVSGDGTHSIEYRSTDNVLNAEEAKSLAVVVDDSSPETTITVGEPQYAGDTLYVRGDTQFTLTATDSLSGVGMTEYRIDGGEWTVYEGAFTVPGEGSHSIGCRSTDNLGNEEEERVLAITVDDTAPVTTITVGEPQHEGADTLYVTGNTLLALDAVDGLSGVAAMEYRIDEGEWTLYEDAFTIDGEGVHTVTFASVDNLGNAEVEQTLEVVVDNTAPVTMTDVGEPKYLADGTLYVTGATAISLFASDNSSGVAYTRYRIDEGEWVTYTAAFTLEGEGTHTVYYRSVDNVDNSGQIQSVTYVVDDTAPVTTIAAGDPHYEGGTLYVTGATVFTLEATDSLSGVAATEYRIDGDQWTAYAAFTVTGEGTHTIEYRSTDNVDNAEEVKSLSVTVDDTAPELGITVGETQYAGDALYVTSETVFTLEATDNLSGVASIEYRIDSGAWTVYEAFTVATEGAHTIGYRSADHVGNTVEKTLEVVVDNTPPVSSISYGEQSYADGSVVYLTKDTQITLSATDALSGVAGTYYRMDGGEWTGYTGSFTVDTLGFGPHTIGFYSFDNVGNAEAEQSVSIVVIGVDVTSDVVHAPRVLIWTEEADIERHRAFVAEALAGTDAYVSLVTTKEEFITGMRSGVYNIMGVMLADSPVDANVRREMREAVNRGMGLLFSAWGNNVHPITAEVLGVKFKGSRPMNIDVRDMELEESVISEARTYTVYSRVQKAELAGGQSVGVIAADASKGKGNPAGQVPAVVLEQYGQGRAVYMAFDLFGSAHYTQDQAYKILFRNMVMHVLPDDETTGALSTVLLETTVTGHGAKLDVRASEVLPEGMSYLPLFDLRHDDLVFDIALDEEESYSYRYFVRLADASGNYTKRTDIELLIGGQYGYYDSYSQTLTVAEDTDSLLAGAKAWLSAYALSNPDEAGKVAQLELSIDVLGDADLTTTDGVESAIKGTVSAIEKVMRLTYDSSELRAVMDEYLRVLEAYHAITQGTDTTVQSVSIEPPGTLTVVTVTGAQQTGGTVSGGTAQSALGLEATVPDYPRVLVWLNDGCSTLGVTEGCVRKDLVTLTLEGTVHHIVESADAFSAQMRSDYYTDYLILGRAQTLAEGAEQELMARVYGGRGLISSHWSGTNAAELFGVSVTGGVAQTGGTAVLDTQTLGVNGAVLAVEPVSAEGLALTTEGNTALVANACGLGRSVFMSFDLGASLSDGTVEAWRTALMKVVEYVHLPQTGAVLLPGQIRPVQVTVMSQSDANVPLAVAYSPGMVLIDSATGSQVTANPVTYGLTLQAGVPAGVLLYVMVPDAAGNYGVQAQSDSASTFVLFMVNADSMEAADGLIQTLEGLKVTDGEKQLVKDAVARVEAVKARVASSVADIEQNISDILAVEQILKSIETKSVDDARMENERFLGIWQELWSIENSKL